MIEIKDLLERWSNILVSKEVKKESVRKAILDTTGIEIKTEDIEIKNEVVYLNIKPIFKNEIFMKKERIISTLGTLFNKNAPSDVR